MRRNKHPNECPTCEKIPCQCAGGGAADDEKSKKEGETTMDSKRDTSPLSNSNSVNIQVLDSQQTVSELRQHITLFDEKNQLMRCMLFGSTANQPTPAPSNQLQENNGENSENTSMGMGMKMGSTDE